MFFFVGKFFMRSDSHTAGEVRTIAFSPQVFFAFRFRVPSIDFNCLLPKVMGTIDSILSARNH